MFTKKRFFIFAVFILLIFAVLTYQGIKGDSDTSAVGFLNYPLEILEEGISIFIGGVKGFFNSYILIVGEAEENQRLTEQFKKIEQVKNQYLEAKRENERLRGLLELRSQRTDYIAVADVFARDPTNWFQILWINKGLDDGISKDMVAITPSGLVGRIHRVFKKRASIILITDVNSSVAARIQTSRIEGILEGRGDNRCYLKYVSQDAGVKVGESIITSGLDGIYPEGILIGFITDVKKESGALFLLIEVEAAQNLNSVEEVAVLKR